MKKISLQWRITLMTAILIGITCVSMNSLIGYSGRHYMDSIGSDISANSDSYKGEQEFFNPESADLDQEVTIIVNGAQESFSTTNWCITAVVTLLGGVLAYFVSGRALKPLHTFASRVENVQPNNLTDMKITDDVPAEFKQFSISFNQMLDRLDEGFTAQRQFTGNAAHELRTPLALLQAQLELFSVEHPDLDAESADFLKLLQEQTGRMSQVTKTLLEMSELRTVPCNDCIELAPMIEEILADLSPVAEKKGVTLECDGTGTMVGSDTQSGITALTELCVFLFLRMVTILLSGLPTQVAEYQKSIKKVFFSRSSVWINPVAEKMAVWVLDFLWFGKLLIFTVAKCRQKKVQKRELL